MNFIQNFLNILWAVTKEFDREKKNTLGLSPGIVVEVKKEKGQLKFVVLYKVISQSESDAALLVASPT